MGICESDLHASPRPTESPKQPQLDALHFLTSWPDGWLTACSRPSVDILHAPGKIWGAWTDWVPRNAPTYYYTIKTDLGTTRHKPPESWFPADGSYGSDAVKQARIQALVQVFGQVIRMENPETHCHDAVSAMATQTRFYDYDFNTVDREERTEQAFSFEAKREICGLVFMEAPLKFVPIGKNYLETEGPNKPYLVFAVPKHVVMSVTVGGTRIEYSDSPVPGEKCFLSWALDENRDMDKTRYFTIYLLARKNKASKWSGPVEYPKRCAEAFAKLFKELQPGLHTIDVSFQFTYTTDKVGVLCTERTETLANHGAQVYGGPPKVERLLLPNMRITDSEQLILKPSDPERLQQSEVFSAGSCNMLIPEESAFTQVAQAFYGFDQ